MKVILQDLGVTEDRDRIGGVGNVSWMLKSLVTTLWSGWGEVVQPSALSKKPKGGAKGQSCHAHPWPLGFPSHLQPLWSDSTMRTAGSWRAQPLCISLQTVSLLSLASLEVC